MPKLCYRPAAYLIFLLITPAKPCDKITSSNSIFKRKIRICKPSEGICITKLDLVTS